MKSIVAAKEKIKPFQKAYPVETVPIAKAVGLRVWRAKNWSNEVSGKIQKCEGKMAKFAGESGYAIFTNADHSETRRRFTIEAMRDQYRSIAELAKLFNVSPQAMAIRMDKATAIRDGKVHD